MPATIVPSIHRAAHRIAVYLHGWRPALGVSQGEAHVLAHLSRSAPASIAELHAAFAHRRSTLTSILDRLANRGDIVREVHPADRRSFMVSLTPEGRRTARMVRGALDALEAEVRRRTTAAERAQFEKVIEAILAASRGGRRAREKA